MPLSDSNVLMTHAGSPGTMVSDGRVPGVGLGAEPLVVGGQAGGKERVLLRTVLGDVPQQPDDVVPLARLDRGRATPPAADIAADRGDQCRQETENFRHDVD